MPFMVTVIGPTTNYLIEIRLDEVSVEIMPCMQKNTSVNIFKLINYSSLVFSFFMRKYLQ